MKAHQIFSNMIEKHDSLLTSESRTVPVAMVAIIHYSYCSVQSGPCAHYNTFQTHVYSLNSTQNQHIIM